MPPLALVVPADGDKSSQMVLSAMGTGLGTRYSTKKNTSDRSIFYVDMMAEGEDLGSNLLRVAQVFQQTQRIRFVGGEKWLAAGFWPHGPNSRRQTRDGLDEVVPVRLKKMRQKKTRAPFSFNQNRSCSNGPI
jgi:hypothetical protein